MTCSLRAGSSLLFNLLGAYLAFVLPQEYGVRKSPFFPIIGELFVLSELVDTADLLQP